MKTFSKVGASCTVLTRPPVCRASSSISARLRPRATSLSSLHHRPPYLSVTHSLVGRHKSTSTPPLSRDQTASESPRRESLNPNLERLRQTPAYELTFTCKPCKARSMHRISKQGYHKGTVLITCPDCKNRHVISDHLKIFSDTSMTIEDLMRDNGELIKKGSLSPDGDMEFWDDGSTTQRAEGEGSSLPKELNSG